MQACDDYAYRKQTMNPFLVQGAWRATRPLQLVHTNLVGSVRTESFSGNKYFILCVDDHSQMTSVFFLKSKSEDLEHFFKKNQNIS